MQGRHTNPESKSTLPGDDVLPSRNDTYTITKRISKHGRQAVIVIPKLLEEQLGPGTIAEVRIRIISHVGQPAESGQQDPPINHEMQEDIV